ncbi:MAG: hypothetical protein JWR84_2307 [Caulobacter sp.]|nr:hypothetical protein [Caulobacter sp.]
MTTAPRRLAPRLILTALGLVAGGVVGAAIARLTKAGVIDLDALGWSDKAAVLIAVCLMALGLITAVASFNRRAAGRMMDPDEGRPATPGQLALYRDQGLVLFLAGVMMAAPVAALTLFDPLPAPIASAVMMAIVAGFLVQTAYNIVVWRRGDELMRRVISDTGAVCFWVLQGLLFLWAAAEKLNLAPVLSTWDVMTILMGFYLLISSVISIRRGLA